MTATTETVATVTGWHFAADKLRDGRPLPKAGETLRHEGECVPCKSGLHFSSRALDALKYAPGFMVARVEGPGDSKPHGSPEDKLCGSWRKTLTDYVDARAVVVAWALGEADIAVRVHLVKALREAATANGLPGEHGAILRAKADDLERLPKIDSSESASAASYAAGAASYAAGAAGNAAVAASYAAGAASDAAVAASYAAGAAGNAAGAAGNAAGAASYAASNVRLEAALSALFVK